MHRHSYKNAPLPRIFTLWVTILHTEVRVNADHVVIHVDLKENRQNQPERTCPRKHTMVLFNVSVIVELDVPFMSAVYSRMSVRRCCETRVSHLHS